MSQIIAGMTSQLFKGIPSLQEVVCSGTKLEPEVKLLSLQMHRLPGNKALASLNVISSSCVTLGDYSSCFIDSDDSRRSKLRILVVDLMEEESRVYTCDVHTIDSFGIPKSSQWRITVKRPSK